MKKPLSCLLPFPERASRPGWLTTRFFISSSFTNIQPSPFSFVPRFIPFPFPCLSALSFFTPVAGFSRHGADRCLSPGLMQLSPKLLKWPPPRGIGKPRSCMASCWRSSSSDHCVGRASPFSSFHGWESVLSPALEAVAHWAPFAFLHLAHGRRCLGRLTYSVARAGWGSQADT